MSGQSESEQFQQFQERLGEWITKQGFWFQLRYSLSGGGLKGLFLFHFLNLVARVGLLAVIVGVIALIFFWRQPNSYDYRENVSTSIKKEMGAEEIEMDGFAVKWGEFSIKNLALNGGEETFFEGMSLRDLSCRMTILDRLKPVWNTGVVEISDLDVQLRAGADSEVSAEAIADKVFQDSERVNISAIEVEKTTLKWGYSVNTSGSITGSNMRAQKSEDGWRLKFQGGVFSQNWLRNLEIVEMDVLVSSGQIRFEKARFKSGENGRVSFDGLKVQASDRPSVKGLVILKNVDIDPLIPLAVQGYVGGVISGEFRVSGSTNSTKGIGYDGKVEIGEGDMIFLRDKVELLRALSVVDAFHDYRRLEFDTGSFQLNSHGGDIGISEVSLLAGDLMKLEGGVDLRLPTDEESTEFNELIARDDAFDELISNDELKERYGRAVENSADQARAGFGRVGETSLFEKIELSQTYLENDQKAAEVLFQSFQYDGRFTISLEGDAFALAPDLAEIYAPEGDENRIHLEVPIKGTLYELTKEQAKEIYQKGAR